MSRPDRFNMVALNHGVHYYCTMKVDPAGAYVLNSDYEALRAQLSDANEQLLTMRMDALNDKVLRAAFMDKARAELAKEAK